MRHPNPDTTNRHDRRADAVGASLSDRLAYTIAEGATLTSLSRSYLYEQIAAGRLRLTKKGKRSLLLRDDLLEYLRGEAA